MHVIIIAQNENYSGIRVQDMVKQLLHILLPLLSNESGSSFTHFPSFLFLYPTSFQVWFIPNSLIFLCWRYILHPAQEARVGHWAQPSMFKNQLYIFSYSTNVISDWISRAEYHLPWCTESLFPFAQTLEFSGNFPHLQASS